MAARQAGAVTAAASRAGPLSFVPAVLPAAFGVAAAPASARVAWTEIATGCGVTVMRRGTTPATADAVPLPPVSGVLEPPYPAGDWSLRLEARRRITEAVRAEGVQIGESHLPRGRRAGLGASPGRLDPEAGGGGGAVMRNIAARIVSAARAPAGIAHVRRSRGRGARLLSTSALLAAALVLAVVCSMADASLARGADGWSEQGSGSSAWLTGVACSDATHAWAVGHGPHILATADGGASWSRQAYAGYAALQGVACSDATHVWAVGRDGTILATTDGGATWNRQDSGSTESLEAVACSDATHVWAVSHDGAILATTDGGATWRTQMESGAGSPYLESIACGDETHVWAVGEGGTIFATADGGATWRAQSLGSLTYLSAVAFADAAHGWVAGETAIYATVDGGSSWSRQASWAGVGIQAVACSDATHAWVVSGSAAIRATTDAGATWSAQSSGRSAALLSVAFADATHGWAVGEGGTIVATTDGGFVPVPAAPGITQVRPAAARRGALVTISGAGFGAARGTSIVSFGAVPCVKYVAWSETRIRCRVPANARYGPLRVTVTTTAGRSNAVSFTVKR